MHPHQPYQLVPYLTPAASQGGARLCGGSGRAAGAGNLGRGGARGGGSNVHGGLVNLGQTCFVATAIQTLCACPPVSSLLTLHAASGCALNQGCSFCVVCEVHDMRCRMLGGVLVTPTRFFQFIRRFYPLFKGVSVQDDAHCFALKVSVWWHYCAASGQASGKGGQPAMPNTVPPNLSPSTSTCVAVRVCLWRRIWCVPANPIIRPPGS